MLSWLFRLFLPETVGFISGGGGGGPDPREEEAEESQREYKIQKDINEINRIFGNVGADYTMPGVSVYDTGASGLSRASQAGKSLEDIIADYETQGTPISGLYNEDGSPEAPRYNASRGQSEAARLREQYGEFLGYDPGAVAKSAEESAATRAGSLEGIYGDIMGYYGGELDRQKKTEAAKMQAALAKRGLSGSTISSSMTGRLGEIYDEQLASLQGKAEGTTKDIGAADERLRAQLIQDIQSGATKGVDSGSLSRQLQSNIDDRRQGAMDTDLSGLFASLDELYGQRQYVDQYNAGNTAGGGGVITPGTYSGSGSGTII